MGTPFVTVSSPDGALTHLAVVSPALQFSEPDELPAGTLCGRRVQSAADGAPADVQCPRCLMQAPKFMALPAYEVQL